jgi:Cu2+-exporting ATPase
VILNSGDAIERLSEIDTVVFDKTGTLTLPEPRVANAAEVAPDLLQLAARLALSSRHPLATAVAREARERVPFEGATEEPGQGVFATIDDTEARLGSAAFCGMAQDEPPEPGASTIAFSHAGRTAVLVVRQTLRPDAVETVAALRARGLDLAILSGDRAEAVAPIATRLGILDWRGSLKPAEKIDAIEVLKAKGRRVLMVGDGLNDAPALAAAHVSLSPISAADITQAHADAVFLGERLSPVFDSIMIAHRARRLMQQNLWLAVLYNAVAVPVAILGLATPLIAAAAMSGSSILVTLNALRVRARKRHEAVPTGPNESLTPASAT